jgi:hypothetical protein
MSAPGQPLRAGWAVDNRGPLLDAITGEKYKRNAVYECRSGQSRVRGDHVVLELIPS